MLVSRLRASGAALGGLAAFKVFKTQCEGGGDSPYNFPDSQLFTPNKPYPQWDANWDRRQPEKGKQVPSKVSVRACRRHPPVAHCLPLAESVCCLYLARRTAT
jgi:hypothetical protein